MIQIATALEPTPTITQVGQPNAQEGDQQPTISKESVAQVQPTASSHTTTTASDQQSQLVAGASAATAGTNSQNNATSIQNTLTVAVQPSWSDPSDPYCVHNR